MLPVGWLVVAVVVAVLLSMWVTFTLTRLDRLHARVDAARAALDAQLVRRAVALLHVVESPETPLSARRRTELEAVARAATSPDRPERREPVENAVGRAVAELAGGTSLGPEAAAELREAAARVQVARRFYNDAVRDTRTLRARRMPRALRLAGRVELPQFFDIDDTEPPAAPPASTTTSTPSTTPAPSPQSAPSATPPPATPPTTT
jgi:hypothetical protein